MCDIEIGRESECCNVKLVLVLVHYHVLDKTLLALANTRFYQKHVACMPKMIPKHAIVLSYVCGL